MTSRRGTRWSVLQVTATFALSATGDIWSFVHFCNRGEAKARGEFLVFLNNNIQVQSGWLDALLDTFDSQPRAGLVGNRLIFPDGRQQEAGGIVFRGGSNAWSYVQLDDPDRPEYSYSART